MSIVTKLPNVSAQSRAFISGRSKRTWHGDLYTQMGAGGNGGKKAWVGRQAAVCVLQNQCGVILLLSLLLLILPTPILIFNPKLHI